MVKKTHNTGSEGPSDATLSDTIRDSAQQIWLAGLGAFAKAQVEGEKVFDSLVKEGLSIQRKTQAAAEERLSEAANRVASMASGLSSKASGQWDKLENIFEDRVARALKKLGVPTAQDLDALMDRIEELNRNVAKLNSKSSARTAAHPTRSSTATAKTPRKRAAARKTAE